VMEREGIILIEGLPIYSIYIEQCRCVVGRSSVLCLMSFPLMRVSLLVFPAVKTKAATPHEKGVGGKSSWKC